MFSVSSKSQDVFLVLVHVNCVSKMRKEGKLPEGVPNSVLKGDKTGFVLNHQVSCIKIGVAFFKHVPH